MSNKVTIQMIANASGYSKYAVSKALNNQPGVKESTRQKILFVAKQLGYFKDRNLGDVESKNIKTNHGYNGFVLVVMPNHRYQNSQSLYWSHIFNGIVDYLDELGIGAIVISSQKNLSEHVKAGSLLGIITAGLVSTNMLLKLSEHNVPIVMIDHEDSLVEADTIFMDNHKAIYQLTNHLIGLGHQRLCYVGDTRFSRSFYDRWVGFRTAMENQALFNEKCALDLDYSLPESSPFKVQLREYFKEKKLKDLPTAFVCANDEIAIDVIVELDKLGYTSPTDFSVTGFDNFDFKSSQLPPLTTVQVLKGTLGRRAVNMLIGRLENPHLPTETILISGELIIRKSTDKPNH